MYDLPNDFLKVFFLYKIWNKKSDTVSKNVIGAMNISHCSFHMEGRENFMPFPEAEKDSSLTSQNITLLAGTT